MENTQDVDCAVCIQKYNHPARLPCEHIFCFLCVKGVMRRSLNCPMCRTPIPADYLDNPVFVNEVDDDYIHDFEDKYWWFYEGKDGWWSYDERSNEDLESDFNAGKPKCKLSVAGAIYCVDFNTMIQFQLNDPRRKRKVKRDTLKHPSKGIAGILKINASHNNNNAISNISHNNESETSEDNSHDGNPIEYELPQSNEIESISETLSVMSLQQAETTPSTDTGNSI